MPGKFELGHPPGMDGKAERKEGEPQITLEFFFSPHGLAADYAGLKERFDQCDIYIPEATEWEGAQYQYVSDVACGKIRPEAVEIDPSNRTATQAEDAMIFNTQKPIFFIDLPKGNELHVHSENCQREMLEAYRAFSFRNFFEAIIRVKAAIAENTEYIDGRDSYMAEQLQHVESKLELNQDLKKKKNLRVLVVLGPAHANILNKIGENIKVNYSYSVEGKGDLFDEITVKKIRDQETSNNKIGQALFEFILRKVLRKEFAVLRNTILELQLVRAIVKRFSFAQIRDISKRTAHEMSINDDTENKADEVQMIRKLIEEVGNIQLPNSEDDFEKFKASVNKLKADLKIE